MKVVALIYVVSLILAYKGLVPYSFRNVRWVCFVVLNFVILLLAYSTVREGYQADASGTAGSGSHLPLVLGLGLVALIYNLVLFAGRKPKKT